MKAKILNDPSGSVCRTRTDKKKPRRPTQRSDRHLYLKILLVLIILMYQTGHDLFIYRRITMKKWILIGPMVLLAGLLAFGTVYAQPMGPGMMGPGGGGPPAYSPQQQHGWYCPYCGRWSRYGYPMGPGMMGPGYGYHMGPGMMGPGYGYGPQYQQPQKPMAKKDAEMLVQDFLKSTGNPNLKLGNIKDEGSAYEVEIVTKGGNSLVDRILVDKRTGWMRSVY
jgi:hypothetical protein